MNRLLQLKSELINQTIKERTFLDYKKQSSIDKDQFNLLVYGPNNGQRKRVFQMIRSQPELFEHFHISQADRDRQRYLSTKQMFPIFKNIYPQNFADPNKITLYGNGCTFYDLNLAAKLGVHYSLYLKAIERLGTEKHKTFYKRACSMEDVGCFGLTQLFHGSNVKGILTEAHYQHKTKSIFLKSPSKEAMKFWIGGAAKTSNMSIIWAQLYINKVCYGVHAFVAPLRDLKTHKVFPGITIGDCGAKQGLNGVDNGFILFDNYRIPVENLLDKISGVNQKGQFLSIVESEAKRFGLTLAALSQGRLFMACHSTTLGLSALAIAIRYAYVRKQFDTLLIQYPLTRRRLFPLLAKEVIYMAVTMSTFIEAQNDVQAKKDFKHPKVQQFHGISSVMKSKTAMTATEVIKQCRQILGGHGFSAYSKMGKLYNNNDINNTWQGDNYVLLQQTSKYVLDGYGSAMKGKQIKDDLLKFLMNPPSQQEIVFSKDFFMSFEKVIKFYQFKIASKVQRMVGKMMQLKEEKLSQQQIWDNSQVFLGQSISFAVCDLYNLTTSVKLLSSITNPDNKKVFQNLMRLWLLFELRYEEMIGQEHHKLLETLISQQNELIKPEVLGILEATTADQSIIGSPFANEDGQGFNKYMERVLKNPMNERPEWWQNVSQ